jgi:hypothetical protein
MAERPKRRSVLRKNAVPDATHYVGYVEDEETPEMIMRKFEEMERIKASSGKRSSSVPADEQPGSSTAAEAAAAAVQQEAAASPAHDEDALDQEQLHAVFKATSMFNVKSVLSNNEALMVGTRAQERPGYTSDVGSMGYNSGGQRTATNRHSRRYMFWLRFNMSPAVPVAVAVRCSTMNTDCHSS